MHEGHRERMRRRLFSHGESLTDCELLEILLFDAISRKNTNPVAHDLLDSFCDLEGVLSAPPRLLCTVAGIGPKTAEHLYLAGTLLRRMAGSKPARRRLYNFSEVSAHVSVRFGGATAEKLEIYMTDRNGMLLCTKTVSDVRRDSVALDSRTLSFILSEVKPANVIVAHNHPSGSASPSEQDDASLVWIDEVCRMHGARLCDSIVFAEGSLYSYYHSGRLKELGLGE